MKTLKTLVLATAVSSLVMMTTSAIAGGHMVNEYVTDSSGQVWKNSYGECWRDRFAATSEKKEECGYEPPPPPVVEEPAPVVEAVVAPAAATVTMIKEEIINISAALLFGFDSAKLSDDAKAVLDERIEKYRGKAELTENVQVIGHTDSTGPEAYNQGLSERRAQSVATYLESNTNITDDQIDAIGKGESEPVASNATRDGRAQNRRVEIHVKGKIKVQQ